jgi:hypothetical protein
MFSGNTVQRVRAVLHQQTILHPYLETGTGFFDRKKIISEVKTVDAMHIISPRIMRVIKSGRMKWEGYIVHIAEMRNAYKFFCSETLKGKFLGSLRRRWKDNIKLDLKDVGYGLV